jgi:signal peptidase I
MNHPKKPMGQQELMKKFVIGGLIGTVYVAINIVIPRLPVDILIRTYLLQPLTWGSLILALHYLPDDGNTRKESLRGAIIRLALAISLVQVLSYFIGGLFSNFGKNPSSRTSLGIIENLFFVGMMLLAIEISRARLVSGVPKRRSFLILLLIASFCTFISLPLVQVTSFKLQINSADLVISSWIPLLIENLTATFLSMISGSRASLAYRVPLAVFWWFCPILPNLNWSLKGLIGIGVPIFGIAIINELYSAKIYRIKSRQAFKKNAFPTGWIVTALICLVITWFTAGVLPFKPSAIQTGSMKPVIEPGDVVIVAKVPSSAIKLGDIIEYRNVEDKINIVHRVIEVRGKGERLAFITKGDNNNTPDFDPVPSQNVIGRVITDVPKIGFISMTIKRLLSGQ